MFVNDTMKANNLLWLALAAFAAISCTSGKKTLLIGTYTGSGSEGIYVYQFDQNSGEFISSEAVGMTEIDNPSFLAVSDENIVYSVRELSGGGSSLTSFSFDPGTYSFTELSNVSSQGDGPCHVSTDGEMVSVANYKGGTLGLFPLGPDGAAQEAIDVVQGAATGPDSTRQNRPHVHCSIFTPDGKYLLASDFSADRLIRYEIATGTVEYFTVPDDSGPRHLTFSPDGKHLYVIGELSGAVTVFEYNGDLSRKQVVLADKMGARGGADIHVSPDGRFLYTSLRLKNDGIAVFRIAEDGTLSEAGYTRTGPHPRNFTISPNGKYLLCACRDSDQVEVYSIDRSTGLLTRTPATLALSKPVCLVWD